MSINNSKPESRTQDIVVQKLEDEVLVYDLLKNKAFCLNETSAIIWQLCDGKKNTKEIADEASKKLNSKVSDEMVGLALEQLNKDELLENNQYSFNYLNGLSRREAIRKIGFTSLVALPIISSLVAPNALHAASGCPDPDNNMNASANGCPCIGANDCTSTCCGTVSGPRICTALNSEPTGSICRANCECISGSCSSGMCT